MSVKTEIERLESAKSALAASIEGKGVAVPAGTKIDEMAALVDQIQTGGGGGGPSYDDNVSGMVKCEWENYGSALGELPTVPSNIKFFRWGKVVCPYYPGYFQLFWLVKWDGPNAPMPNQMVYWSNTYDGGNKAYFGGCRPGNSLFIKPFGNPPEPGFPLDYYIGGIEYAD